MKKTLFSLTLGLALLAGASVASAQSANGAGGFVGVSAGSAHLTVANASADRFAYGISGGYRWDVSANQSLGAEVGYVDFGNVRGAVGPFNVKLSATGETLGANYRYTFGDDTVSGDYFVAMRAGYLRWNGKVSVAGFGSATDHGNGFYAGVGLGHDFTRNISLSVNYDFHRANDVAGSGDHINAGVTSIGAQYRF